ncbi:WAP four-disulfide core domain protein 1-like [Diadema antillarum]|uniref:WAP four-disulfide core domain protein 1-like n=1 Tax=Diadema antillarum TaxID=105358 RepID=UPI003A86BB23
MIHVGVDFLSALALVNVLMVLSLYLGEAWGTMSPQDQRRSEWVECSTPDPDLEIQSLLPRRHQGRCPPPSAQIPPDACSQCVCRSDRVCPLDQKCCYNGCRYTCMNPVQPPPVFDWLTEPRRQRTSGNAWLVPGPEETHTVESCSTSTFDEGDGTLLECPTGYQCFITYDGDPENSIPNKGICIKIK